MAEATEKTPGFGNVKAVVDHVMPFKHSFMCGHLHPKASTPIVILKTVPHWKLHWTTILGN